MVAIRRKSSAGRRDGFGICVLDKNFEERGLSLTTNTNGLRNLESLISQQKCERLADIDIP